MSEFWFIFGFSPACVAAQIVFFCAFFQAISSKAAFYLPHTVTICLFLTFF